MNIHFYLTPPKTPGGQLLIEPTLIGLHWIIDRHYTMPERTPQAFNLLLQQFLLLEEYTLTPPAKKAELGILSASPVMCYDGDYYLLAGENGLSAIQLLGRDWFLKCNCIKEKGESEC